MKKIILAAMVVFLTSVVYATPVVSRDSTIFVILNTVGEGGSNSTIAPTQEITALKNYVQSKISAGQGYVYCASYNVTENTPREFYENYLVGQNSVFEKAKENWRLNAANGKSGRVPSHFIVVAEGFAGLAVREYIQSKDYKGEIRNVAFFDTPHEGTGFADQALFARNEFRNILKDNSSSSLEALIPLALVAYLLDGIDGIQDFMLDIVKDAVMGIAYGGGDIRNAFSSNGYFEEYEQSSKSLWYLAQDADISDAKYVELVKDVGENMNDVDDYVGSTQLLNSYSKSSEFSHPNYNVVYSYGFPTVGNGRKTLEDFSGQGKLHISKNRLQQIIVDSLKTVLDEKQHDLNQLASEMIGGQLNKLPDLLNNSTLSKYVQTISDLRNVKLNKDDVPGSALKLLSIVEKYIPDTYKSELYSVYIKKFTSSENVLGMMDEDVKNGLDVVASSLSSYSLNFFDEGVFDVPSMSAKGHNVDLFKKVVTRPIGVDMAKYVDGKTEFDDLNKYRETLAKIGSLEKKRIDVDDGLKMACVALSILGEEAKIACEAAEFATNVAMIGEVSSKIKSLVDMGGSLKATKNIALRRSVEPMSRAILSNNGDTLTKTQVYSQLDEMMFSNPQISIVGERLNVDDTVFVAPQIYLKVDAHPFAAKFEDSELLKTDLSLVENSKNKRITVRDGDGIYRFIGNFDVEDFIDEIHFQIDDLQPDSLWWIALDFNNRIQIIYERQPDGSCNVYLTESYGQRNLIESLRSFPVQKNGFFAVQLKDVLGKYNDVSDVDYGLAGIQEDGANLVFISAMNKVGYTGSAELSYFFRATDFHYSEGWPRSFDEVSDLKKIYVDINNYAYPYELIGAGLKLSKEGSSQFDSVNVALDDPYEVDGVKYWRVSALVDTVAKNVEIVDGKFILEWELRMKSVSDGKSESISKMRTVVYVDKKVPDMQIVVPNLSLTGTQKDGKWVNVVNSDSVGGWAVRAMRAYVRNNVSGKTTDLFYKVNTAEYSHHFGWSALENSVDEGPSTLVVQAYDFANIDSTMKNALSDIYSDSGKKSWNYVWDASKGKFIDGINGMSVETVVWIDKTKPGIHGPINVQIANPDATAKKPNGTLAKTTSGYVLNSLDTLKLSFDVQEPLIGRQETLVRLYLTFKDVVSGKERSYSDVVEFNGTDVETYLFEEPEANRLIDGVYSVSVEMTDEAGNIFDSLIVDKVVVDRTPPTVSRVGSGNTAADSISHLKNVNAVVMQNMDVASNRLALDCYKQLEMAGAYSAWSHVNSQSCSQDGDCVYDFSVVDLVSNPRKGLWNVYLSCYDAAGNVSMANDFWNVGERLPRIEYPNDSINPLYYGTVVVKGVAPNPIINGGDETTAEYKIEWRTASDSVWQTSDVDLLEQMVSENSRTLALWNVSGYPDGEYILRLSSRGCADSVKCPWVSVEKSVEVYEVCEDSVESVATDIDVVYNPQQAAGQSSPISVRLSHATDTSKWVVKVNLKLQSPQDPSMMVESEKKTFDPAAVSPFSGKPSSIKNGLNVWQDGELWNVVWVGDVKGLSGVEPVLSLKYQSGSTFFVDSTGPADIVDEYNLISSIKLPSITIPAYDRVKQWNLMGDSLHIMFKSDSSFILDLSSVDDADSMMFCGSSGRLAGNVMPEINGVGVMYVHPKYYNMNFMWPALIGGLYPGGDSVYMRVVAYNKNDLTQVITKEKNWNLVSGMPHLTIASAPGQIMPIGLRNSVDDTVSYVQSPLAISFGLEGRSAYVSADILNPDGNVVKNLMDGKSIMLAGTSKNAKTLSWGGIKDNSFASSEPGTYKVHIVAKDAAGEVLDAVDYPFEVVYASGMIPAPEKGLGTAVDKEAFAELSMDEAELDENDDLRFVGRPDYLMKVKAGARVLSDEDRVFRYKWEWDPNAPMPKQAPALYKKNRFSVGIRRQRGKFEVAMVTLVTAEMLSKNVWCDMRVSKETFEVGKDVVKTINIVDKQINKLKDDLPLSHDGFNMGYSIKMFPIDVYEEIVYQLSGVRNYSLDEFTVAEQASARWENFWSGQITMAIPSMIRNFFNDFNNKPYWSSNRTYVNDNHIMEPSYIIGYEGVSQEWLKECSVEQAKGDANANFVCGSENAEKGENLESFNPHKNMVNGSVSRLGVGSIDGEYNSNAEVGVYLKFSIDDEYWDPPYWGYNNLANRYVRFDPTNKTLYQSEGYFNFLDSSSIAYKNFYGEDGWTHKADSADVTAFEAARFAMANTGMNPLLFADEVGADESGNAKEKTKSKFWVRSFENAGDPEYKILAETVANSTVKVVYSKDASSDVRVNANDLYDMDPMSLVFYVAPLMTPSEAFVLDTNLASVSYPYSGNLDEVKVPDGYKLYKDFRSRVRYGVGGWTDARWDSTYTTYDYMRKNNVIINPLTDYALKLSMYSSSSSDNDVLKKARENYNKYAKNELDNEYSYVVKELDGKNKDYWEISYDSLRNPVMEAPEYGGSNSISHVKMRLYEVDFDGNRVAENWTISPGDGDRWKVVHYGDTATSQLEYVFSKGPVPMDENNRSHKVPFDSVKAQNPSEPLLDRTWRKSLDVRVDSLCARDSSHSRHPFFEASYDAACGLDGEGCFNVTRKGVSPDYRVDEMATLRGRVPMEGAKWTLQYTKNGMLFPIASGVQDSVPSTDPYPILANFNMNQLQGNSTFFMTYGGDNGELFYKSMDVHVGTLVRPDTGITVTSMYANASVHFDPGAWGESPVDVTIRTVSKSEYNYSTFKDLAVVGPVIEILPSHVFTDSSRFPYVTVTLSREDVHGLDVSSLKIYKPNFSTEEIVPLETNIEECIMADGTALPCGQEGAEDWKYVKLKAVTSTFSTFLVSDSLSVAEIALEDSLGLDSAALKCGEFVEDTLWMGLQNGWLEYPHPCRGKGNYLMQLRTANGMVVEHRGAFSTPIIWNARTYDIPVKSDLYTSRLAVYGTDGTVEQIEGPYVRLDSILPVLDELNLNVVENGGDRLLQVGFAADDVGSGIKDVKIDVYLGGRLLSSRTLPADSIYAEQFVLKQNDLWECQGCRVRVDVFAEDWGHNHVEESLNLDNLYPYPMSLALWYPFDEGAGNIGHEIMGSGFNLDLSSISTPWALRSGLLLSDSKDSAVSVGDTLFADTINAFSVEIEFTGGHSGGSLIGWNGTTPWSVGVQNGGAMASFIGALYFDDGVSRYVFPVTVLPNEHLHLVLSVDGNMATLYKNGEVLGDISLTRDVAWRGVGNIVAGRNGNAAAPYAVLSDVRIYKSALVAEQVESLYNGGHGQDNGQIVVARATDVADRDGLVVDQSCGVAGRSYVRQKNSGSSGMLNWNVDVNADDFALYLLMRNYASEDSRVEVLVNGESRGAFKMNSSGYWESQRVGSQTFDLRSGENVVSVRPMGNVGIAGLALVSANKAVDASKVNYGEGEWTNPAPRVSVNMYYAQTDGKTINPMFQIQNMTSQSLENVRLRYYYKGESESVQAVSYYPYKLMNVSPDAGSVFYAELALPDAIAAYGSAYYGNGPQLGLNRVPNDQLWYIFDDPSYSSGAEKGYVKATGIALLDEEGEVLNEWACHDADGAAVKPKKSVRALVADERFGDAFNSTISMVVENTGSVAIDGFESRYYFRDSTGKQKLDVYYNAFADTSVVNAGGNLYYVSFMYSNVILNPGEKSDYGNGVKFSLYNPVNPSDYDASDDPSYHGISALQEYVVADSVVVLDKYGNLLWGEAPRPQFSSEYVVGENRKDLIHREGDVIYVTIESDGRYTLETVNAVGMPQSVLFNGTWTEGEHSVALTNYNLNAGSYLVLRRGNTILSWQVLK